jgi:hypothetical protein
MEGDEHLMNDGGLLILGGLVILLILTLVALGFLDSLERRR